METLAFLLQTAVITRALFLMPFEGRRKYARLQARLRENPRARVKFFVRFLIAWWATAAVVLASLALGSDTPAQLRFNSIDARGVALIAAWVVFVGFPVFRARKPGPYRDAVRQQLELVPALLPGTRTEKWLFAAVSVTAGLCEELVFRGLIPLYFAKLLPGVPYVGAAVSILGFGVAHAYQGVRGVVLATVLGAIFHGSLLLSGTLFVPMIFHALNDLRFLALVQALARPRVDKSRDSP